MVCPTVGVYGGCMVTALAFGSSGQCLSLGQGHFGVFLGNSLYSHSALLRPGLKMGTGECHTGVTLRWTSIPFRGSRKEELELLKVTSYTCVFKKDLASTSCNKACATCCEQKPIETKFGFVLFVIKESNYTVSLRIIPSLGIAFEMLYASY